MPRQTIQNNSFPSFRKISIGFVVLALILLIFIVYFSFAKATIVLTLSQKPKTLSFDLTVSPTSTQSDLRGRIVSKEIEVSKEFFVQNFTEQPGIATGKIRIINNHTRNQPLVKTTRFLSPKGILFRLKDTVNVPAGGEIVAEVYADKEGAESNIGPTKFTIPGLSANLQQKIYGISDKPMTGGVRRIGVLTEDDIQRGQQGFLQSLDEEIKNQFSDQLLDNEVIANKLIKKEVLSQQVSNKAGEEVEKFTVSGKVLAQVILLDPDELLRVAKEKYKQKVMGQEKIISWQVDDFDYQIKSLDQENNNAVINVKLTAEVQGNFDLDKFNKKEIAGFDKKGIEYYFSQYPSIEGVEVKFWPFWVKSAPALASRIEVKIK